MTTKRTVKVWPTTDRIAREMKHPSGAKLSDPGGNIWPADQFTFRRLRDGDIVEHDPTQHDDA